MSSLIFLRALTGLASAGLALFTTQARAAETPGELFVPQDVDYAHPVYVCEFDSPEVLKDWALEGKAKAAIADGNLRLISEPGEGKKSGNLVFWLRQEMPADFLLEFTFRPQNRVEGLAIVFFCARGKNGESIFDPTLARRNGSFRQYHSGDINNYHVSFWSGSTRRKGESPSSHIRKNLGFNLVAEGQDLVVTGQEGTFQTVRIYKHGGKIRVMVDDVLAVSYDDDGQKFGPVHESPGWIGLRQMAHTQMAEYGRLAVYPLK